MAEGERVRVSHIERAWSVAFPSSKQLLPPELHQRLALCSLICLQKKVSVGTAYTKYTELCGRKKLQGFSGWLRERP